MSIKTVVKVSYNNMLRRFEVPVDSFNAFENAIKMTLALDKPVRLSYTDIENDQVVFDSDRELQEALSHGTADNSVLRVQVHQHEQASLVPDKQPQATAVQQEATNVAATALNSDNNCSGNTNKNASVTAQAEIKSIRLRLRQLREEIQSLGKDVEGRRPALRREIVAVRKQLAQKQAQAKTATKLQKKAMLQQKKAALQQKKQEKKALKQENKAVKQENKAVKLEKIAVKQENIAVKQETLLVQEAPTATAVTASSAEPIDSAVQRLYPLRIAAAQFLKNGLKVKFLTPEKFAKLKNKNAVKEFRAKQQGFKLLNPPFVKRVRALATQHADDQAAAIEAIQRLVDTKSQVLSRKVPFPMRVVKQRFQQNGLNVVFITPEKRNQLKCNPQKGSFQEYRRSLEAAHDVVLMPAFVTRCRTLADNSEEPVQALNELVDNKSKVLLSKGKGQVSSAQLGAARVAISAKQAQIKALQQEVKQMRRQFKQDIDANIAANAQQQQQSEEMKINL